MKITLDIITGICGYTLLSTLRLCALILCVITTACACVIMLGLVGGIASRIFAYGWNLVQ